jgi:Fuc2NAc and GlcNAc transferase
MLAATLFLVSATSSISLATWAIISGTFLVDATCTLFLRIVRREQLTVGHRSHLYQRLALFWGSHLRVTALYFAVNVFWLAPLAAWSVFSPDLSVWIAVLALSPLVLICMKLSAYGRP